MTAYSANLAESATSSDVATVRATARFKYVEVAASRRNPALPPNLVINPGFESPVPTQPWVNTGAAAMWSVTTADKASGDHSVLLAPTLAGFYGVQQFVYVEPGKTYTFSASLNRVRGSAQLSAYLFWVDRNLATISNVLYPVIPNQGLGAGTANVPIGAWTRYAWTTLPAPPGAVALQLSFAYPAAPAGSTDAVYIDEVQMEAGQLTAFETMGAYDTLTYTYKGAHSSQTALVEGVPSFDTLTTRKAATARSIGNSGYSSYVRNPSTENTADLAASISGGNSVITVDTTRAHSGLASYKVVAGTSLGTVQNVPQYADRGLAYTASCWVYLPSGCGVTHLHAGFQWFSQAGGPGYIAGVLGPDIAVGALVFDAWNLVSVTATPTATALAACAVNMYVEFLGLTPGLAVWVDDMQIVLGTSATTLALPDVVTKNQLASARAVSESAPTSDASTHSLGSSRALSESVPLIGSTLARSLLGARALVETLSTDDGLAIQLAAARALSESGTVSDAVVAQLLADHRLKVWDGTAWVVRPVLWWDGSDWATKRLWRHNGSRWVLVQDRS